MSHPVPPAHPEPGQPAAAQPYSPAGVPFDGAGAPQPQPQSTIKKVARVGVPLVAAGVAAASWFGLGGGEPEVGDCGKASGDSSFDGAGAPQPQSTIKKVARVGVPLVAAGVAAASWFGLGGGEPEVGDCGKASGDSSFDVVDCDSDEAMFRIVGIEEDKMTQPEYEADTTACAGFPTADSVLWVGDQFGLDGTVLCAEPA